MTYATILKLAIAIALSCLALVSCSTPKASWGNGDGMNKHCQNKYVSNRVPFNFN
jgi:hypothetical protein